MQTLSLSSVLDVTAQQHAVEARFASAEPLRNRTRMRAVTGYSVHALPGVWLVMLTSIFSRTLVIRSLLIGAVGFAVLSGGTVGFSTLAGGANGAIESTIRRPAISPDDPRRLRVATLNLAHGRGTGLHQAVQGATQIRAQLSSAAALLAAEQPALIALQEVDHDSVWSGGFDHVAFVAERVDVHSHAAGKHVDRFGLHYGTAVLSNLPVASAHSYTFAATPPTPTKGWVLSTVQVGEVAVDVVSVHLDFSRAKVRAAQAAEMIAVLSQRDHPLVLMGDLNAGWGGDESVVSLLCHALTLHTWEPESPLVTFPAMGERLDWILVSDALELETQWILETPVSDHRVVVADLRLR